MPITDIANEIRLIEAEGTFWVDVIVDGCALQRRGPFADIETAEGMAIQLAGICGVFNKPMEIRQWVK
jgi:hypothetical protein